jgi:hypothetical protein
VGFQGVWAQPPEILLNRERLLDRPAVTNKQKLREIGVAALVDWLTTELDLALSGLEQARQQTEQRRFTRTIGSLNVQSLSGCHREISRWQQQSVIALES